MDDIPTIFVIDDEPAERRAIADRLVAAGWKVGTYATNSDCLREIQAGARPACIIADLRMSHLSGAELIARLRKDGFGMPVIIVTGLFPENALVVKAVAAGAAGVLYRPLGAGAVEDEVRAVVTRYCSRLSEQG